MAPKVPSTFGSRGQFQKENDLCVLPLAPLRNEARVGTDLLRQLMWTSQKWPPVALSMGIPVRHDSGWLAEEHGSSSLWFS